MSKEFIHKDILFSDEMLDRMESGVKLVHDAVGSTMGPGGQLVMFEEAEENPYPTVTKDGVTVASMIAFKDQAANNGAQFVIQAARKQVYETGDGTTLTSILTYKIFKEGRKLIKAGFNHNLVVNGIKKAVIDVVNFLKSNAITDISLDNLINIAKVSTNNDITLATMIAEAVHKTGQYGMVFQEKSTSDEHSIEYQDGYQLNIGITEREFANIDGKVLSINNPYILVTDQVLVDATRLIPILKEIKENTKDGEKANLIIISPSVGGDIMQVMKRNITDKDGQFFLVHIKPSRDLRPDRNKMIFEDLAAITGGMFISKDSGYQIDKLSLSQLGTCSNITSYPERTLITGYNKETSEKRIKTLSLEQSIVDDPYTKELINESLARLTGGIATIKVGGRNLSEQYEILHRVDDAVKACKSTQEMGYVRGGGVAMLEALRALNNYKEFDGISNPGYNVILESLKYPAYTILNNSKNESTQSIINSILAGNNGYEIEKSDVKEDLDMLNLGIVDPAKVIIYALKNSASAALSMLQTNVMIIASDKD